MKDKLHVLKLMERIPLPDVNDKNISARALLVAADFSREEKDTLIDFAKTPRGSYGVNTHDTIACLRMHVPFFLYHCKVTHGIRYDQWDRTDTLLYVLMGTKAYTDLDYVTHALMGCDMSKLPLTGTGKTSTKSILIAMDLAPDNVPVGVITKPFKEYYLELTKQIRDLESPEHSSMEVDHWTESNAMGGRFRYIPSSLCTREFKYLMTTVHDARRGINKFSAQKYIPGMIFDLYNWDNEDIGEFPTSGRDSFILSLMHRLKVPEASDQLIRAVDILRGAKFTEPEKELLRNFSPKKFTGDVYTNFNVPFFLYYCYKAHGIAYDQWDYEDKYISILEGSVVYSSLRGADKEFLEKLLNTDLYIEGNIPYGILVDALLCRCAFKARTLPKDFLTMPINEHYARELMPHAEKIDASCITQVFKSLLVYVYHMKRPESTLELVEGGLLYKELLAFRNTDWYKETRATYLQEKEEKEKAKEAAKEDAKEAARLKKIADEHEKFLKEHPDWTPKW